MIVVCALNDAISALFLTCSWILPWGWRQHACAI